MCKLPPTDVGRGAQYPPEPLHLLLAAAERVVRLDRGIGLGQVDRRFTALLTTSTGSNPVAKRQGRRAGAHPLTGSSPAGV